MTENELEATRINTQDSKNWLLSQCRHICPLFESVYEKPFLEQLEAHQLFSESLDQGAEIFIISGELGRNSNLSPTGTWLRLPQKSDIQLYTTTSGTTIYVKIGHLQHTIAVWGNN